jgi:outer membrane protein OmpA-like peptidoglycan-associated protein
MGTREIREYSIENPVDIVLTPENPVFIRIVKSTCTTGVTIVDGNSKGIENVPLSFSNNAAIKEIMTDATGLAKNPFDAPGAVTVRMNNFKGIRNAIKKHWQTTGYSGCAAGDESQQVVPLLEPLRSFDLSADEGIRIMVVPGVLRVRLIGMFFDSAKCFMLPSAIKGIKAIKNLYDRYPDSSLLVVGHTDDSAKSGPEYNDTLSLERAEAVASYLTDKVDKWYKWYKNTVSWEKQWGRTEDLYMLSVIPDEKSPFYKKGGNAWEAYTGFQKSKNLPPSGEGNEDTRKALIAAYMAKDKTSLPQGTELTIHGCGQHFPDKEKPAGSESESDRNERQRQNRRVEIFLFDGPVSPPPQGELSGPGATDYPAWKNTVSDTVDFSDDDADDDDLPDFSVQVFTDVQKTPCSSSAYRVFLKNGQVLNGTTDTEGKLSHTAVEAGDYELEIGGQVVVVNTVPKGAAHTSVIIG